MQKIGDSTTTANAAKEFSQGQPGTGISATIITVEWLNALQRELVAVLTGAGLAVTPADDSQLYKAIQALMTAGTTWAKLGGKPTTVAGYGLTDAYTKAQVDTAVNAKAAKATTLGGYGIADAYTAAQVDTALGTKAAKATTIAGYGITDAYTKAQVDISLSGKANNGSTLSAYGITDAYTKTATYSRLEVDDMVAQSTETRQGTAKIASQVLVDTGADDTTFVTPKKLRLGVSFSFGANGYFVFPSWLGGWIIQWGSVVDGVADAFNTPFPVAFTTGVFKVIPVVRGAMADNQSVSCYWDRAASTLTTARIARRYMNNGGAVGLASQGLEYIAFGK